MAGVNKVILLGNLGKDPEVKVIEGGRKVARFTLATTESYKDKNGERQDKTEWHNLVFWGPTADIIERFLKKGSQVYIEGKIATRSYEKDGVTKYITEITGQNLTMLGGKSSGSNTSQEDGGYVAEPVSNGSYNLDAQDDDLPF